MVNHAELYEDTEEKLVIFLPCLLFFTDICSR